MTEKDWLSCANPMLMVQYLEGKASDRKLRLFACGCCRHIWELLPKCVMIDDEERGVCRQAVETAERYADGLAGLEELMKLTDRPIRGYAAQVAFLATTACPLDPGDTIQSAVQAAGHETESLAQGMLFEGDSVVREGISDSHQELVDRGYEAEEHSQSHVLRCVFGNPFRPTTINSNWLTPNVTTLATVAYEQRALPSGELDSVHLAILADALEEADCDNQEILGHLRGPGPHVRACHVLDLVLGRK